MVSIVHYSDIVCKRFWDLFAIFLRPLGIVSQRGVECKCILGKPGWTEGGGGGIMEEITQLVKKTFFDKLRAVFQN